MGIDNGKRFVSLLLAVVCAVLFCALSFDNCCAGPIRNAASNIQQRRSERIENRQSRRVGNVARRVVTAPVRAVRNNACGSGACNQRRNSIQYRQTRGASCNSGNCTTSTSGGNQIQCKDGVCNVFAQDGYRYKVTTKANGQRLWEIAPNSGSNNSDAPPAPVIESASTPAPASAPEVQPGNSDSPQIP